MRAPFLRGGTVGRVRRKIVLPVGVVEQVGAAWLELELGGDVAEREQLLRRRVGGHEERGHRAARVARVVVELLPSAVVRRPPRKKGARRSCVHALGPIKRAPFFCPCQCVSHGPFFGGTEEQRSAPNFGR